MNKPPDPIWEHALQTAITGTEFVRRPERIWEVGITAYKEHALAHALTAMQTLAETGDASALLNVGLLFSQLDRSEEAIAVYDQVVTRFGADPEPALREQVAMAQRAKAEVAGWD